MGAGAGQIADQIGFYHVAPILVGHFVNGLSAEGGTGDKDVDAAKPPVNFREYPAHLAGFGDIGGNAVDPGAAISQRRQHIVERRLVTADRDDARAAPGQQPNRLAPDAGASTGDQHALSRQRLDISHTNWVL